MGLVGRFWTYLANFSKRMMSTGGTGNHETSAIGYGFGEYSSRMSRYSVLWSFYENTTYENFNPWIRRFLGEYGLFTEIDGYFNPVFRLVEFWATHLMGGTDRKSVV